MIIDKRNRLTSPPFCSNLIWKHTHLQIFIFLDLVAVPEAVAVTANRVHRQRHVHVVRI